MGKPAKEEDIPYTKQALNFAISSACSIALPVAVSFYVAPEQSREYYQNTLQGKVEEVMNFDYHSVITASKDVLHEVPPMLETEWGVLSFLFETAPPIIMLSARQLINTDYRITLAVSLVLLIIAYRIPWRSYIDWITNVLWGSMCVVSTFLPMNDGINVLAEKDAGMYRMMVTIGAVAFTLAANYVIVMGLWWLFTFSVSSFFSLLWRSIWPKKKQEEVEEEEEEGEVEEEDEEAEDEVDELEETEEGEEEEAVEAEAQEVVDEEEEEEEAQKQVEKEEEKKEEAQKEVEETTDPSNTAADVSVEEVNSSNTDAIALVTKEKIIEVEADGADIIEKEVYVE